ncbi:STM4011 family radical SAM protein [Anaerosinus massiliensis]|uniref:STM4011 family radical SAM protein n=1 Tax=Massilibacillus massiliensis TaxID=1806837 RepID=UPI000DA5F077|nr:STM4011 family radical SAM protein [Massilibacillus massiliensis]
MCYTLYYRNYLKSCNYTCGYCPFAKTTATENMLAKDMAYLHKFIVYLKQSTNHFRLFFAPRGEALVHEYYRQAMITLSKLPNIEELVIQTNLSSRLDWLNEVASNKLILWTTYHPGQVTSSLFVQQIEKLRQYPVRFTVGIVGVKENFAAIAELYQLLQQSSEQSTYLWINAYKDKPGYYSDMDIAYLLQYDKLFKTNLQNYKCKDRACKTGTAVFFVEWDGMVHRCWQDKKSLGNLYIDDLADLNMSSLCQKRVCSCFIGYSHIVDLALERVYQTSLLGRLP